MRGDQTHLLRPQAQYIGGSQIRFGHRLVRLHDFRAQNCVPRNAGAFRHVQHQNDVAIRKRRNNASGLESREAAERIGPRIQPMPCQIQLIHFLGRNAGGINSIVRQHRQQVLAVQDVEPCEGPPAAAYFLHGRTIPATPCVGEFRRIDAINRMPRQKQGCVARHAAAPIHDRAEYIEYQCFNAAQCHHVSHPLVLPATNVTAVINGPSL